MPRVPKSPQQKPVHWVGSSKGDLLSFPSTVIDEIGYALSVVQFGGAPPSANRWKGEGGGVFEIVESEAGSAYRAVYAVRFERAVYVLHCFQKKSPSGKRTARNDIDLIHSRLTLARQHYEALYG